MLTSKGILKAVALSVFVLSAAGSAPAQDRGARTLEYWNKIKEISDGESAGVNNGSPVTQQIAAMRNVSRRINELSARGVDPDAIEVAERLVRLCKRAGDYLEDYGDPQRGFKSGFRDGLNGYPTRAIDEKRNIAREVDEAKEAVARARKQLESRYDKDFPDLFR